MTKERVLIAGDIHGNVTHAEYLCQQARKQGVSKIMQVGDFGAWEHMEMGVDFFDKVQKFCARYEVTMYWLDGNHDKTSLVLSKYSDNPDEQGFLKCRELVRYAPRGHRWTWGESSCMALGGAYSVDKFPRLEAEHELKKKRLAKRAYGSTVSADVAGTYWFPEEEITGEEFDRILNVAEPVDVLFTHDKPRSSSPGWNRKDFLECLPNQDRIEQLVKKVQPKRLWHGHLHYPYECMIHTGDGYWCGVQGLDCDQPGYHPGWRREDSWCVAEL